MEQGKDQSIVRMVFHEGPVPDNFKADYEPYLFNTKKHRALQNKRGWKEFHCLDQFHKLVLSSAYFCLENGKAKSPVHAPFGGFEFSSNLQPENLLAFIKQIEDALKSSGVKEIEIVSPPELYSTMQPLFTTLLLNLGFEILIGEPGACIVIDEVSLANKMSKDKKARLRQCFQAGLTFEKMSLDKLELVYNFISECRTKQARKLSMSFQDLLKTVKALPKSFFLVSVFDKNKMIGACICVRVKSNIVYTFYSAHDSAYDTISPRVFLLSNLYDWCFANKINLLDLGTSALNGEPNFPLLDFKLRVGATLTHKFKFWKKLT